MAEPFLAEIRMMSFNFPPRGWAMCNGQLLPINQNQALFSLLGTTYGGDGRVSFGLPNLQGRTPIHQGSGHTLGERGGEQSHTLTAAAAAHGHALPASTAKADQESPENGVWAVGGAAAFGTGRGGAMDVGVNSVGGSQAHLNMQPFLTLTFCVALQGIFPSQT